jgi:hypothetical protein
VNFGSSQGKITISNIKVRRGVTFPNCSPLLERAVWLCFVSFDVIYEWVEGLDHQSSDALDDEFNMRITHRALNRG